MIHDRDALLERPGGERSGAESALSGFFRRGNFEDAGGAQGRGEKGAPEIHHPDEEAPSQRSSLSIGLSVTDQSASSPLEARITELKQQIDRLRAQRRKELNDPYASPNYRSDMTGIYDRAIAQVKRQLRRQLAKAI